MADISKEINDFRKAVKGKDVRGSMISLAEKVNEEVETNTAHVDEAVDTANGASQTANQTSKDAQKAITEANTTLQAANAAKESAQESSMAASVSAAAAAGSEGAAGESAISAAASAKAVEDIAAGMGGFDGTATSVKATDTQGIVVAAGADSNAQALLDALAHKVALELVSNTAFAEKLVDYVAKTDIVQVESTATNKVPSSAYLKQVKDDIYSNLPYINTSKKIKDGFANGISWTATENCIVCGSIGFNYSVHGCTVFVNNVAIYWANSDADSNTSLPAYFVMRKGDVIKFVGYDSKAPVLSSMYAFGIK